MTSISYELPKPPAKTAPRVRGYTLRFNEAEFEAITKIAARAGVTVGALLRSYVHYGIRVSAEKLKGEGK